MRENMITGSIQVKNGTFYTVCRVPNEVGTVKSVWRSTGIQVGKTRREQASNRAKALVILEQVKQDYETTNAAYRDLLFLSWVEQFIKRKRSEVRENTWEIYDGYFRVHIAPFFAPQRLKLTEVLPHHIQRYLDEKTRAGLSANTLKKHMALIRGALRYAYRLGAIGSDPCDRIVMPSMKKFVGRAYTEEQAIALLHAAKGEDIEPVVVLALMLGLRRSEILGLRWSDIDFGGEVVHIRNTVTKAYSVIESERTKSKASRRDLPLTHELAAYLRKLRAEQSERALRLGAEYTRNDHVAVRHDGRDFSADGLSSRFTRFLQRHDLPRVRLHDLRHTAASLLLAKGLSVKHIQEYLGHENVETTLSIYAHLNPTASRDTANALAETLGRGIG